MSRAPDKSYEIMWNDIKQTIESHIFQLLGTATPLSQGILREAQSILQLMKIQEDKYHVND